ncbi:phage integrase family protein [Desulforamulus reducens MI-1]|uniref:Phage integrase family protein n=1 Tax=Desulforamulus reducens (strain ATCC BAA-1160 / DSM 100696 / MI-1) TaxID=349161 RepID=A4J5J2_DESRM|nr:tyrosine-type recombinase/integrase [Desulforamulus reducens]ABO50345.1 phage integrase family protein [Desulforamulus reducens MI-1]
MSGIEEFKSYLLNQDKSINTIKSYVSHVEDYSRWFQESFGISFTKLYRENILDFKSYLLNIKNLNAKSINAKLAALMKLNEFILSKNIQEDIVVFKTDYIKVQTEYASPAIITRQDVESFRQTILENESKRDYAIVTLLAYSGMRISEAVNLKLSDVNLTAREIVVRYGKGKKQRLVIINDKVVNAIKTYLSERTKLRNRDSEYLFVSRESCRISRTRINHIFNGYSDKITPHMLRHFFCSYALEKGWSVHEVAGQAGHANIHTTLIYTNPSMEEMKRKSNLL